MSTTGTHGLPATDGATPSVSFRHFPDPGTDRERTTAALLAHPTPIFIGDRAIMLDRVTQLRAALERHWPGEHTVAYSFKTNYQVAETGVLRDAGVWAEVVSGREYRMASRLGHPAAATIFNGPYKADGELQEALADGAAVHINDDEELRRVLRFSGQSGEPRSVALRISATISGLSPSRFGFPIASGEAAHAIARVLAEPSLRLDGLHVHLKGDTDDPTKYGEAGDQLGALASAHVYGKGHELRYVDMGGGFPGHGPKPKSRTVWHPLEIDAYVGAAAAALRTHLPAERLPRLVVEPGRYLVADSIIFVTRIIRARSTGDGRELTCDASITMLPSTHYARHIIRMYSPALSLREGDDATTRLFGSSCREDDLIFEGPLAAAQVGDLAVVYAVGAYNANMSPSFIFETPSLALL